MILDIVELRERSFALEEVMGSTTTTSSTETHSSPEPGKPRASNRSALLAALLGIPLLAAVLLSAFVWPASSIGPRDLPIGVTGLPPARPLPNSWPSWPAASGRRRTVPSRSEMSWSPIRTMPVERVWQ